VARVEPVPGAPAATAAVGGDRALLIADYHAGIERALRYERGVELDDRGDERRERLLGLLDRTGADRLVVLGDLAHRIDSPRGVERAELDALIDAVTARVPMTLVVGNHDAGVADGFADRIDSIGPRGGRMADVGLLHGHTWPEPAVLGAGVLCVGHEHPQVRLEDAVGGGRTEPAWLRGPLDRAATAAGLDVEPAALPWGDPELVVFPAFNRRSGGGRVNVDGREFLVPFLPAGLASGELYLLDGTRLGDYRRL
jgi:metallophosphoesterase superfamily enzyme